MPRAEVGSQPTVKLDARFSDLYACNDKAVFAVDCRSLKSVDL